MRFLQHDDKVLLEDFEDLANNMHHLDISFRMDFRYMCCYNLGKRPRDQFHKLTFVFLSNYYNHFLRHRYNMQQLGELVGRMDNRYNLILGSYM